MTKQTKFHKNSQKRLIKATVLTQGVNLRLLTNLLKTALLNHLLRLTNNLAIIKAKEMNILKTTNIIYTWSNSMAVMMQYIHRKKWPNVMKRRLLGLRLHRNHHLWRTLCHHQAALKRSKNWINSCSSIKIQRQKLNLLKVKRSNHTLKMILKALKIKKCVLKIMMTVLLTDLAKSTLIWTKITFSQKKC